MRVLYADHTTRVSGAQRSLLDLLAGLPDDVEALLASPAGPLRDAVVAAGRRHVPLPATTASLRLHPVHTVGGVAAILATAGALLRHARQLEVDVVHANTLQAGLAAGLARRLGGPPTVVHIRDCLPDTRVTGVVRRWISYSTDMRVANSKYTARRFGAPGMTVVPPTIEVAAFDGTADRPELVRQELGIAQDAAVLTVLAQITPWKGQSDAIEVLDQVRRRLPDVHLLIVGEPKFAFAATRYDNVAYLRDLHRLVADRGLGGRVHFTGEREDVSCILAATDVLLVPSWEEPFGRAVIEASAMAVPVVATNVGGTVEIIEDGVDGVLLAPRSPARWAGAVADLLEDPHRRRLMGGRARVRTLERYTRDTHAARTVELYRSLLHEPGGQADG